MSRSKSSSALVALYILALPATNGPAFSGQTAVRSSNKPVPTDTVQTSRKSDAAKKVVVVTGTLDLGKVTLSDFGDIDTSTHSHTN